MFVLFLFLVALIPLLIGIMILIMFKNSKLSKALFLFLFFASIWQMDVASLYAYGIFSEEIIDFVFRLLRIGSIMLSPTLFFVAYIIMQEELPRFKHSRWRLIMNKKSVALFYIWSLVVYLIGWSKMGIQSLKVIAPDESFHFYFPTYGSLSWVFHLNVMLFTISIILCFFISLRIKEYTLRSFLFYFILTTTMGYGLGILNMFPETRLFPSAISVMVFAISVLILSTKMHVEIVNSMNNSIDQQRKFLRTVIDLNPNYIYARDEEGRYSLVNLSYAKLFGMKTEDMIGKTEYDIQENENQAREIIQQDKAVFNSLKGVSIPEEVIIDKEGNRKWLQTSKIPITTDKSTILLGVATDITERMQYENELTYQAKYDVITELPNRRLFNEDLTEILKTSSTENNKSVIMLLDLDRFKYINDTLGHDVGDLLLIEVARRLEKFIDENHYVGSKVYRIGGDEFTLLFPHCNRNEAIEVAALLLNQFQRGFAIEEKEFHITPSIGISVYPDDGYDAKTLMKNADTAMYYVKEREKNNFKLFTQEMNHHFYRKMVIEKELRMALEHEEFQLNYQPLLNIKSGAICGMEALIRWKNKTLGNVSPGEFIEIAEETGLIIPIGEWVLKTACKQGFQWQQLGYAPMKIGVNISIRQLMDENFVNKVATIIEESGLHPSFIDLEVTESIAMFNPELMITKLSNLKKLGVSLSMDDFGTGYSSLSYLKRYPLDTLKIDRSFIKDITTNEDNMALVKSIISMANNLNLNVTAEGVENQEEYQFLSKINCHQVQGYGISHPLTAENFESNILKNRNIGVLS